MDWMVMISLRMVCISYCSIVKGVGHLLLPEDGTSCNMEEDHDGLCGGDKIVVHL